MPFISLVTSVKFTEETRAQVRDAVYETIALVPRKSADVTMVELRDGADITKAATNEPALFCEIRMFTRPTFAAKREFVAALTEKLNVLTGVDKSRMYFNILEFYEWGSGGDYKSY